MKAAGRVASWADHKVKESASSIGRIIDTCRQQVERVNEEVVTLKVQEDQSKRWPEIELCRRTKFHMSKKSE